ncbi:MAG: hypothetical protein V3U71_03965 [Cocleimonas sp.]
MKKALLSTLIVLSLISIGIVNSKAYAAEKTTIYKVTRVATSAKLQLRAWPSNKSRIKVSLPHNAKDLTETGKKKVIGKAKWLEVNWKNKRGWVNAHYLKKTGVLLHKTTTKSKNRIASSRNNKAKNPAKTVAKNRSVQRAKVFKTPVKSLDDKPEEYGGNRYDQPTRVAATNTKTSLARNSTKKGAILLCDGNSPKYWNIKMDVNSKNMHIKFANNKNFQIPIKYHNWATARKVSMNIGGNKGRNIVDVNLEKTDACNNGLTRTNFTYEVNATINKNNFSGCCEAVTQ